MRNRIFALSWSPLVCVVLVGLSCTTDSSSPAPAPRASGLAPVTVIDDERPIYVSLPANNDVSPAQWNEYLSGRVVGHRTSPRCVDNPDPVTGCRRVVPVEIAVVEGGKEFDTNGTPSRPQLIAWLENPGDPTNDGLAGGRSARYALVVDSRAAGSATAIPIHLVEFRFAPNTAHPRSARAKRYGHAFPCHRYAKPYKSDVYYAPCQHRAPTVTALSPERGRVLMTSLAASAPPPIYLDDPIWFTCNSGCCTSSGPGGRDST